MVSSIIFKQFIAKVDSQKTVLGNKKQTEKWALIRTSPACNCDVLRATDVIISANENV